MCNVIKFSPEALSSAAIANIMLNVEQSEINEQIAKGKAQEVNGKTADANASVIKSSLDAQAQTTRSNGWGEIGAGIAQGGAEVGAIGYDYGRSKNNDYESNSKTVDKLDKWQEALDKTGKTTVVAKVGPKTAAETAELDAARNRLTEARGDLNKIDIDSVSDKASGKTYRDDLEAVQGSTDSSSKDECIEKLEKTVSRQKKAFEKRVKNFQGITDKRTEKLRAFGQVASNLSKGFQAQQAAASTENQAKQEQLKAQTQFASDSGKSNVDGINKDLDAKKSVKDSSIQLMSSMIQENRV